MFPFLSRAKLALYKDYLSDFTDEDGNRYYFLIPELMSASEFNTVRKFETSMADGYRCVLVRLRDAETMIETDKSIYLLSKNGARVAARAHHIITPRDRSQTLYAFMDFD